MSSYKTLPTPGDTAWFTHDRFGMFIHFGLYAMPARHEWVKNYEEIPEDHYDLYFKHFNPDLYDPKEWARQAKAAGMKYVVMTTKHHEGFCLFDSKYTDYKSTNTLCGKDLIREYVDAFRAEGLHIGFYYSLIDWHHPEFPIDPLHPRRDDPDAYEQSKGRDIKKYAQYMRDQVTELLTNYGKIDILWFDFSYSQNNGTGDKAWQKGKGKDDWEAEKLIATARALQPHIIIDNRTEIDQDLWTPEQYEPDQWVRDKKTGELVTWEACHTFSGSWGYFRDEQTWKSPEMLIRLLVNTVSRGGNLLMNIGYVGAFWTAMIAMGGSLNFSTVAITYLTANAAGSFIPSPGGIGTVETALTSGLTVAGISSSVAIATALLYRLVTFYGRIPFGWLALKYIEKRDLI